MANVKIRLAFSEQVPRTRYLQGGAGQNQWEHGPRSNWWISIFLACMDIAGS